MFKKLNKKGFTLAELLVVVAIIGVLVAISIPIFTSQLEKAKEATDAANIRAAYAEVSTEALTDGNSVTPLFVTATQTKDKWQMNADKPQMEIGGINVDCAADATGVTNKGWEIAYDGTKVTITAAAAKSATATAYPAK